jgi:hypothetical protein
MFKDFARHTGLDCDVIYKIVEGRAKGTRTILDTVLRYYDDNELQPPETSLVGDSETLQDKAEKALGLDHILDQLDLNPARISASESLAGNYLLFSYISDKRVGVTWIELKNATKQIPIPIFTARRPGISGQTIFQGFYYEHMTTLFLFGHIARTPLGRSLVLVPAGQDHYRHDRHGVIAGASLSQSLFTSTCFLKWIGRDVAWRRYKDILGERQDKDLSKYGQVLEFMQLGDNLTSYIARMGG